MLVYRMEHKEYRCGPFTASRLMLTDSEIMNLNSFMTHHAMCSNNRMHPAPESDGIYGYCGTHKLGVSTLDDILAWFGFGECLTYLRNANYIVRIYSVPYENCIIGRTQIAFIPNNNIVEEIEL